MEAIALLLLYFLPTVLAAHRGHANTGWIFFWNLLLGWTGIAWIFLLAWSLRSPRYVLLYHPTYGPYYTRW